MSIQIVIRQARKKRRDGRWWVMHPSNDSILAYCDSEKEADEFIQYLNDFRAE